LRNYLDEQFDLSDPALVSALDEMPLWSAPFGARLLEAVAFRPDMTLLDVGCGTGFPLLELAQRCGSSSRAFGIDPWEAALARARGKITAMRLNNITLVKGVAEELPFGDHFFDLIVSNNGINNVKDAPAALEELFRVAKPGAQMVATVNLPGTMREFYRAYERVLRATGRKAYLEKMRAHIDVKRKPLKFTSGLIRGTGFRVRRVREDSFVMRFRDGSALLDHFFIKIAFLEPWKGIVPAQEAAEVFRLLEEELNAAAWRKGELRLTVPFACLDCRKPG
jgi:ubiquinone/menaquinone biosynthesis C-methylase UbiE